ncbi:DUF2867 domain-containing protein [Dyella sp. ASV21]|uniref:DUF2867 domain-containing protein n=1 Tax=Dyella sp. ASV21 TaxID=2795114 RepID=UPI0018ECFE6B|nr:DUF2867 domain-containing protein [Dyella sp. ASV21]
MPSTARAVPSFPSARLPSRTGGLPIDVTLIAQMGHGAGDRLVMDAAARQQAHANFIDAMEEPSAKLAGAHFDQDDPTSLYSFVVGAKGHPFHRHAGHRVFTAISGSAGVQLRFSDATLAEINDDPGSFLRTLRYVDIPPDCLFSVRFGGETWHQFVSPMQRARHPALFALSCHTNELGGNLPASVREQVRTNAANIPSLTELLPPAAQALLDDDRQRLDVPTIALSLDAPAGSVLSAFCHTFRGLAGTARRASVRWRKAGGFATERGGKHTVIQLAAPASDSLLHTQLPDGYHHEDAFVLVLDDVPTQDASQMLGTLLEAFVAHPPAGVSTLMALRNVLMKPFGLRMSTLGCPVSSLQGSLAGPTFLDRFPVIDQSIDAANTFAQVILGADDKHLRFRSCVSVRILARRRLALSLETRVACTNLLGHVYMAAIAHVHRGYVSPAMLRMAATHAFLAYGAT